MSLGLKGNAERVRHERIVADLVNEVALLRERVVDLEAGRLATERVLLEVRGLGQRLDAELEKVGMLARQMVSLDRKVEENGKEAEAQQRKLVAMAKSVDWQMDSLRKVLEALLEENRNGAKGP